MPSFTESCVPNILLSWYVVISLEALYCGSKLISVNILSSRRNINKISHIDSIVIDMNLDIVYNIYNLYY